MDILRVADRSVTLLEEPRCKSFEKHRKSCDFRDFDDFSLIQVGAGRGGVQRYEHIYFLDRSRCSLSEFERIWRGLGDSGSYGLKVQLQSPDQGACASPGLVDRPGRSGRSRNIGNRKSARK